MTEESEICTHCAFPAAKGKRAGSGFVPAYRCIATGAKNQNDPKIFWLQGFRLLVKWPGVTRLGTVSEAIVHGADFYPTILEMAGLPLIPSPAKRDSDDYSNIYAKA